LQRKQTGKNDEHKISHASYDLRLSKPLVGLMIAASHSTQKVLIISIVDDIGFCYIIIKLRVLVFNDK
jgi:hypothetical protein